MCIDAFAEVSRQDFHALKNVVWLEIAYNSMIFML